MRLCALLKNTPSFDVVMKHGRARKREHQVRLGQFVQPRGFEFLLQFLPVIMPGLPLQGRGKITWQGRVNSHRQSSQKGFQLRLNFRGWTERAHLDCITDGWTQSSIADDHLHDSFTTTPEGFNLHWPTVILRPGKPITPILAAVF